MKLIFLASKELSWLWILGFHFPKLDYHQWLKVHTFSIWEIRHLEEFNMLVLLSKQSVAQRRSCLEICVHQVVANCCSCNFFPKFLKILDSPFNFMLPRIVWIAELYLSSATNLDFLEFELRSIVYHCQKSNDSITIFFPMFWSLNKLV